MRGIVPDSPIFSFTRSSNESSLVEMIFDPLSTDSLNLFFCRSTYLLQVSSLEGNNLLEDWPIFLSRRSSTASLARILMSLLSWSLGDHPVALVLGTAADPSNSLLMRSLCSPSCVFVCGSIG